MPAKKRITAKKPEKKSSVLDFFKFGESYSSLILGIVVVIVGTVLLLSLARTRSTRNPVNTRDQAVMQNEKNSTESAEASLAANNNAVNTITEIPTSTPTANPTAMPTPTTKPTATPVPTKVVRKAKPTAAPKVSREAKSNGAVQGRVYVVKTGDTLWNIAERAYKSGYNWVDIARANKLSNPDSIEVGQKLTLPKAEQKSANDEPEWTGLKATQSADVAQAEKITGTKYKVKTGDNLWSIAVRAYGDGYRWTDVAKANKLSNPDLILEGTTLNLPRK